MKLRIHRFVALPHARQWLLLRSFAVVAAIRLRLFLFPFRSWKTGFPARRKLRSVRQEHSAPEIAWAVTAASSYVPKATCLVRALAAQFILARAGRPSRLHIGVAPGQPDSGFSLDAHAWLECGGQVLLGGPDTDRYRRLLTLDGSLE